MSNAFDLLLVALVVAVAVWIIGARDSFASVVGIVAYGLLLALVWVRIVAPDVALTEAAIGSGLTGALLLPAATRIQRAGQSAATPDAGPLLRPSAMGLCVVVTAVLAVGVLILPYPAPTLAPRVAASLPATGLNNPVAAVLIAYRAVDTLLEVVVLVLATAGVWSLALDRRWGGVPGPRISFDPSGPLTLLTRCLVPIGIVIALYIFWVGSRAPGGEFQASAILAAIWTLAMTAGLLDAPPTGRRWLRALLVLGPIVFLVIGFAGFAIAGGFLAYPEEFAKPIIITIEVVLMLSIAVMLGLLVAGPPRWRQRR
jgi:multisubunit Na+/H+ antiporter MnhB subunit